MKPARKRAQAIIKGRGHDQQVIIPLALETAARISARPLAEFRNDATQLSNGLKELQQAIRADGVVVSLSGEMELQASAGRGADSNAIINGNPVAASLEACRRLRQSLGDDAALLAGLTGPSTLAHQFGLDTQAVSECFAALVKAFCEAGADFVLLFEDNSTEPDQHRAAALKTADNIARFHQSSLLSFDGGGLPAPLRRGLTQAADNSSGLIVTEQIVSFDEDIAVLGDWVQRMRGQ